MRSEGDRLLESVEETLSIAAAVGCRAQITHHKAGGRRNWGKVKASLARVDAANERGADVTLDVYPYIAGSGPMLEYFDLNEIDLALAEIIQVASCPSCPAYDGRRLTEIAATRRHRPRRARDEGADPARCRTHRGHHLHDGRGGRGDEPTSPAG